MHENILSDGQVKLLPFIKKFKKNFYLAGGTAIALYIGHRRSIDFDLFTGSTLNKRKVQDEIRKFHDPVQPLLLDSDQYDYLINGVKCTFLYYPYTIKHDEELQDIISIPLLLDLAAMKAFALGRRSKWKDYVDMYFILKDQFSISEIVERATEYFPGQVTEKLFKSQLAFHKDIDYNEEVDYLIASPPSEKEIKEFLIDMATTPF